MSELSARVDAIADKVRAKHAAERVERAAATVANAEAVEQRRAELREAMPDVARVVDLFRDAGIEVKVLAAAENGRSVVNRRACERLGMSVDDYQEG